MSEIIDTYQSILRETIGDFRDRGSKFLGYCFPCNDLDQFEHRISEIRKEHGKATHHCFAYRIGFENFTHRFNDDGEPSGTAGKPIYGAILKHDLYDIGIVVVRYYGGTKLGTGGLINAYREAALEGIQLAEVCEKTISVTLKLGFDYSLMGELMNQVKACNIEIKEKNLTEFPNLILNLRKSKWESQILLLKAKMLKVSLDQVDAETKIPGLKFTEIQS